MLKVLDHGFVRLVNHMGSDLDIVRAARVSYDADWRVGEEGEKDKKLIGYLLRNKHTSPFESVVFTFEIKCPIFIARQWHRHRTWSYNEVSARYTELPEEFYTPEPRLIGTQSESSKQARDIDIAQTNQTIGTWSEEAAQLMEDQNKDSFRTYQALLKRGVPRELARSVLPVSTYTRFFGTVDLHNLLHFLTLRLHPHAQYEIRVYAEAIVELIGTIVPITTNFFLESINNVQ